MLLTRSRPRAALAAAAVAMALAVTPFAAATAQAADLSDAVRLETGHIDAFNLALNEDNSVRLTLKEDVTGSHVLRTPESVELFVKREAYLEGLPPAYLPPGAPTALWYLPLTQNQNLIWPGWDSQGVASYYGGDANVDISVSAVDGPGDVYLWSADTWGTPKKLLTEGWKLPGTIHQGFLAHVHANWGFTAPGTYKLTTRATVTSEDGSRTSTSNSGTYTFVVQPLTDEPTPTPTEPTPTPTEPTPTPTEPTPTPTEPTPTDPAPVDPAVTIDGVADHYHTGGVATLTAKQSPDSGSNHYHWYTRASEEAEWVIADGPEGPAYGFVVMGSAQVKAVLYDDSHEVIAESEPVNIVLDDHGSTPGVGPELSVSLPADEGALAISVAPEGRTSELSDLTLNSTADRFVSEGSITGITVTDTRPASPGWAASGRVRGLVTVDGAVLDGKYLGWTPEVVSTSDGQSVSAGDPVAPGYLPDGNGIKGWSALGSATAGASVGTAVLGADLRVEAPTSTTVGDYTGVVLITVI